MWVRRGRDRLLVPVAAPLAAVRVSPWVVSLAGVSAAFSTVFTLRAGQPGWASVGFTVALVADAVDGAVARRRGVGSGAGKLFDQLCDSATFAALVLAAGVSGMAGAGAASLAVYLATAVVAVRLLLASLHHRRAFLERPRAGFAAHLPKLPFYVVFPAVLMGWAPPASVEASLWLVSGLAGAVLVGLVVRERRFNR